MQEKRKDTMKKLLAVLLICIFIGTSGNTYAMISDSIEESKVEESKLKVKKDTIGSSIAISIYDIYRASSEEGITIKVGKKEKTTKKVVGSFDTKKGEVYFVPKLKDGFKGGFFTSGKGVYHSDKKGKLDRGWKKLKGNYYYFDRKTGKLAISKMVDGIKVDKYGVAADDTASKMRIGTYISARKVVEKQTKPEDSKDDKLLKCYKWLEALQYKQFRSFKSGYSAYPDSWDALFADDIFKSNQGCCVSESAALAYMAKECGYDDVILCSDTGHAWVVIDGRLYDPLFAEGRSFSENYNASFSDYRTADAPITKKI